MGTKELGEGEEEEEEEEKNEFLSSGVVRLLYEDVLVALLD